MLVKLGNDRRKKGCDVKRISVGFPKLSAIGPLGVDFQSGSEA